MKETKQERICNCGLKESEHHVHHPFTPKQETLEEAALNYSKQFLSAEDSLPQCDFKQGAEWQKERMGDKKEQMIELLKWRETRFTKEAPLEYVLSEFEKIYEETYGN